MNRLINLNFATNLTVIFLSLVIFGSFANAQIATGGNYTLTQTVIANGGANGTNASVNGIYKLEGTIGQSAAGTQQQIAGKKFQPGFWTAAPLAPTAANVTVGGKILTANGRGIRNVLVTLTASNGESRTVISSTFGYFRFSEVAAGETYILSVRSKRFTFSQPSQVISITEDIDGINFVADVPNGDSKLN